MNNTTENCNITKSGFVAIIGEPNVGKSTLLNYIVGAKVSIVTNRPQTTRGRILGVLNRNDTQIVFIDTPGLHNPKNKLSEYMMKEASHAISDVDVAVFVSEPTSEISDVMKQMILRCKDMPSILLINKIDMVKKDVLLSVIDAYSKLADFTAIIPISAKNGDGVDVFLDKLSDLMEEGPAFYDEDTYTDKTVRELCAEFLREKALQVLDKEIPHGIAIEIESFKEKSPTLHEIKAVIYVEKDSHKGIIIGKKGAMIKRINSAARFEMEKLLETQVYLEVFIKVREKWRESSFHIKDLGFK